MKNKPKPPSKGGKVTGARLIQIARGVISYPAAVYKGEVPKVGSTLRLAFGDDTYTGVVFDVTDDKGVLTVQFKDGLTLN